MFQIIQNDVATPQIVQDAIFVLNTYGYNIEARPTGKLLVALEGTDDELVYFFDNFTGQATGNYRQGAEVDYIDLLLLDEVSRAIQATKNSETNDRDARHRLSVKYFGETTSHDLHRNLGGYRSLFKTLDRSGSYSVKLS